MKQTKKKKKKVWFDVSKFTKKTKRHPDEEADLMIVAKAGTFITQPAVGTTA